MLIVTFGAVVSDPFFPATLCTSFVVLALFGRRVAWRLGLLSLLAYTIFTAVVGDPWWSNRFPAVGDGLTSWLTPDASAAVGTRIVPWLVALVMAILVLAGLAMTRFRFTSLRPTVPLVPLAFAALIPVLIVRSTQTPGAQVLGLLLPFASVIIARILTSRGRSTTALLLPMVTACAVAVFLIVRFGSTSGEQALTIVGLG